MFVWKHHHKYSIAYYLNHPPPIKKPSITPADMTSVQDNFCFTFGESGQHQLMETKSCTPFAVGHWTSIAICRKRLQVTTVNLLSLLFALRADPGWPARHQKNLASAPGTGSNLDLFASCFLGLWLLFPSATRTWTALNKTTCRVGLLNFDGFFDRCCHHEKYPQGEMGAAQSLHGEALLYSCLVSQSEQLDAG